MGNYPSTILIYIHVTIYGKVQVGNDQEKAQ